MEHKGYNIPKLTGGNYFLWRIKIELVLHREKVWSVINEDPPQPRDEKWHNRDMNARAIIGLSLEDNILINMNSCMTTKDMWLQLEKTYRHTNLTSRLCLLKKLYGCHYKDHPSMEAYLNQIKEFTERLKACGEVIKDNHVMAVMLCGLPSQYDPIITAIESKPESELSLEYVEEKLWDEANRKESNELAEEDRAMAASVGAMTINRGQRGRTTCYGCGREGHIQRYCKDRSTESYRNNPNKMNQYSNTRGGNRSVEYANQHNYMTCEDEVLDLQEEWAFTGCDAEKNKNEPLIILDSGASAHMTCKKSLLMDYQELQEPVIVNLANGERMQALGIGNIKIHCELDKGVLGEITLKKVLWIPNVIHNLVSIKKLCEEGYTVSFTKNECVIDKENVRVLKGNLFKNVYVVKPGVREETLSTCIHLWHERLAHRGIQGLRDTARNSIVRNMNITPCNHQDFCSVCPRGGMIQKSFKTTPEFRGKPFQGLTADLVGPIKPATLGGKNYMMIIIDKATNYAHIELLKSKSETTSKFIDFIRSGRNKFGYYPQYVRTDGGREFINQEFDNFLRTRGIQHQTSIAETPQQNGKSERVNRTIIYMMRKMIKGSELPLALWGEAAVTAVYIYNRAKHSSNNLTPYEGWWGTKPSIGHLRVFGSEAYSFIHKSKRDKLGDTSVKGRLVGYGQGKKGYRIWVEGTGKVITSINVIFNENMDPKPNTEKNEEKQTDIVIPSDYLTNTVEEDIDNQMEVRRSLRSNKGIPAERLTF